MSKIGKASLLICGLFVLGSGVAQLVIGMWHDSLYVSLGIAAVFFLIALVKDHRTYLDFFTMRTTKHGMNMGVLILVALAGLIIVNYISVKNDKKVDWTSERLNSLSDQSLKAAKAMKEETNIVLLSRQEKTEDSVRRQAQQLAQMYQDQNAKIRFTSHNARQRPDLAQKYGFTSGPFGLFMERGSKHVRVEQLTEEEFTKALIKLSRETKKTMYFTVGHGERSLEDSTADGMTSLKEDLSTVYDVKTLNLVDTQKIPDDAAAVVVAGPTQQFLETELQALRNYARGGGELFIAIDPGARHNLAQLTKTFGVEFRNNYVLDPRAMIPGRGNVASIGMSFSRASDVTKSFPGEGRTVFELGSALARAPDAPAGLKIEEVVRTDAMPFSTNVLSQDIRPDGRGPFTLAVTVDGKLPQATDDPNAPKENKEFSAFIAGDSDFLTNKLFFQNLNRDLTMNAAAYLAKDTEMISIRPKMPKGTMLEMTSQQGMIYLLGFLLPLPILLFSAGGVIWYRRRTA